jgi:hypothetical protein
MTGLPLTLFRVAAYLRICRFPACLQSHLPELCQMPEFRPQLACGAIFQSPPDSPLARIAPCCLSGRISPDCPILVHAVSTYRWTDRALVRRQFPCQCRKSVHWLQTRLFRVSFFRRVGFNPYTCVPRSQYRYVASWLSCSFIGEYVTRWNAGLPFLSCKCTVNTFPGLRRPTCVILVEHLTL